MSDILSDPRLTPGPTSPLWLTALGEADQEAERYLRGEASGFPVYDHAGVTIWQGDVREVLGRLESRSVNCCVTSPPYWGLRDYGTAEWEGGSVECDHVQGRPGAGRADGIVDERMQRNRDGVGSMGGDCRKCGARRIDQQLGLERTPEEYIARVVDVFREVRRVLRDDGTLWLNIGDSYARNGGEQGGGDRALLHMEGKQKRRATIPEGSKLKPKDLVGIPWMLAFALRADGWYLRSEIIWHKPNPMPESVTDRPTKSHEQIFLLSKTQRYFYDADAIREPATKSGTPGHLKGGTGERAGTRGALPGMSWRQEDNRNKRSVWTVPSEPFPEAHFATYPQALIRPCILAGCPEGGLVLDPFLGSGTTALVAKENGRRAIGIELSPEYIEIARGRLRQEVLFSPPTEE